MTIADTPAVLTDIDIDFPDRDKALEGIAAIPAMQHLHGKKVRHNTGVYFQDVPLDPLTGLCAYDYKEAGSYGYFKIDFLPNHLYAPIRDEAHLDELITREPEWSLLQFEEVVSEMNHIKEHFDIVQAIAPTSIEDLAVVIALIRPGKMHLRNRSRPEIDREIWLANPDGYTFKRSHAIAFATSLTVQLNLIQDRMIEDMEGDDAVAQMFG